MPPWAWPHHVAAANTAALMAALRMRPPQPRLPLHAAASEPRVHRRRHIVASQRVAPELQGRAPGPRASPAVAHLTTQPECVRGSREGPRASLPTAEIEVEYPCASAVPFRRYLLASRSWGLRLSAPRVPSSAVGKPAAPSPRRARHRPAGKAAAPSGGEGSSRCPRSKCRVARAAAAGT
eukprot:4170021-Prymnesium_polylepis.2